MSSQSVHEKPWSEVKGLVNKAYKHVCGHAALTDLKTLLQRNDFWSEEIVQYVAGVQRTFAEWK